jgi:hypothetical protein
MSDASNPFGIEEISKITVPGQRTYQNYQSRQNARNIKQVRAAQSHQRSYQNGQKIREGVTAAKDKAKAMPSQVVNHKVSIADVGRKTSEGASKLGSFVGKHPGATGAAVIAGGLGVGGYSLYRRNNPSARKQQVYAKSASVSAFGVDHGG